MFRSLVCAALMASCAAVAADETVTITADNPAESFFMQKSLPCPHGWTVEPNPSQDDSLAYMTEDGRLAVSVSLIKQGGEVPLDSESYSRVAAEQMSCSIPVRSNLIENAWSFMCSDMKVEGVIYGGEGDLVLLGISGRSEDTEKQLMDFVRFLAFQAGN